MRLPSDRGRPRHARFNYNCTLPDGRTTTSRALAHYRLADGKVVINDVMFVPDLMQVLGPFMASAPWRSGSHVDDAGELTLY